MKSVGIGGPGRGRPRETSHAEIRDAARDLFAERGFDSVSMAQIADALGIGRTTLYAYFPNKRDLMWEEVDARADEMRAHFAGTGDGSGDGDVFEVVSAAIRALSRYSRAEHAGFARRHRIMNESAELRAHAALRTSELAQELVELGRRRAPSVDPEYIDDLTHALMAVAARAIDDWARQAAPAADLDDYVGARMERFLGFRAVHGGPAA